MAARSAGPRSRLASRVDRVLNSVLAGDSAGSLNLTAPELLAESNPVASVIAAALDRPDTSVDAHWRVHEAFRRAGLSRDLVDSLVAGNPLTRAAAARLCGALRLTDSVPWIGDLLEDKNPRVREAAIRALAQLGGRRAVDVLMAGAAGIPLHRLAIALSRAASDIDIESLMRQPASEKAATATVLACGLRRDVLRVPPLLGIAHDRRWPRQVRVASCKALGMIGDASAIDGLAHLASGDPDAEVKKAAERARLRLRRIVTGGGA
jgi:HEAT repeat protein